MLNFDNIVTEQCNSNIAGFWEALEILLKSPHLINRRILASTQCCQYELKNTDCEKVFKLLENFKEEPVSLKNVDAKVVKTFKQLKEKNILMNTCSEIDVNYSSCKENEIYIRFAKLLPRHTKKFSDTLELALIDTKYNSVTFFYYKDICDDNKESLGFKHPYQIKYEDNKLLISVQHLNQWNTAGNIIWLKDYFLLKLLKWIENEKPKTSLVNGSIKLISSEKYSNLYNNLKLKYGPEMVKIWPENTDPLKFVYEDVAIATYLILLWEDEREKLKLKKKQSFLDLGCGNGLLVHILNSENYPGLGIDLRSRKIWELYPETTNLEVRTIIPSAQSLFPETDWLIGNHSDELTPWIPVIAARSSYKCRFFLLPCCPYEFDGKKYQRDNSNTSQYFNYMQYIQDVSKQCGFETKIDKLRIPSTKRICLIGYERNYSKDQSNLLDLRIQQLIDKRCNTIENHNQWSSTFKPREVTEKVRNCTQIDKSLISNIIDLVVSLLLRKVRMIHLHDDDSKSWNAGGEIELKEIAASIDAESLKELKNECGGLQTLLKNNGHIFKLQSGIVRFRIPGKDKIGQNRKSKKSNVTKKVKPCWFYENHPNGCPLIDEKCDFKHSQ